MTIDRSIIDPEGRFPFKRYTKIERNALRILAYVSDPRVSRTRDAIQIDSIEAWSFTFLVTAEAVEVRFVVSVEEPIETTSLWKRRNWRGLSEGALNRFIKDVVAEARRLGRMCLRCERDLPLAAFGPRKRICLECDGGPSHD